MRKNVIIAGLTIVLMGLPALGTPAKLTRTKAELMGRVEQFFMHNFKDVTWRKSIEWGCIFAADAPIVLDNEMRIYYSAQPGKHGWNPGHLCLATLRLDGWAGYEPKDDSKEAVVETQPIVCNGKTLSLAADAQDGSIAVTVKDATGNTLAESKPLTGSKPYTTVKWKNGFTLSAHKGQTIRLGFRIKQAKLYSFKFGDPFPVS